jgi:ATP/maltotriose-dependent transcriptional regulator MalT
VDQLPEDKERLYLYMLAQLQEFNGDREGALASYRRVQMDLKKDGNPSGRMVDDLNAAIKRLSR